MEQPRKQTDIALTISGRLAASCAVTYMALPTLLFLLGWVRPLFSIPAAAAVAAASGLLVRYNSRYKNLLYNVTTASEFNQDFKTTIDLKMYYYVIESQYSDGLPLEEVRAAQQLAEELLSTTTEKDSSMAISSVLSLCHNLE